MKLPAFAHITRRPQASTVPQYLIEREFLPLTFHEVFGALARWCGLASQKGAGSVSNWPRRVVHGSNLVPPSARILVQLKHPSIQLQFLLLRSRPGEGCKPGARRCARGRLVLLVLSLSDSGIWEMGRENRTLEPSPYSEEPLIDGLLFVLQCSPSSERGIRDSETTGATPASVTP